MFAFLQLLVRNKPSFRCGAIAGESDTKKVIHEAQTSMIKINQSRLKALAELKAAKERINQLGLFPLLSRPSFLLTGSNSFNLKSLSWPSDMFAAAQHHLSWQERFRPLLDISFLFLAIICDALERWEMQWNFRDI
jgi:hypothetical protein